MQKLSASTFRQLQDEAERGSMQAQYALGSAFFNGNGVKRNPEEGAKWLKKAAEQGHIAAQCDLGVMCQKGIGVEQDFTETVKWFHLAAEQGDALAQHNLGSVYAKGFKVKGMGFFNPTAFAFLKATQDFVEAYKWFSIAAANGHGSSLKDRMIIKMRMSAAQISRAEDLIKEFQKAAVAPPDETYDLILGNGGSRRVHIQERDDIEDFVRDYNARFIGGGVVVRVVSKSLQKQRLATYRDGIVWPSKTPTFYVHFSDEEVSELNLEPTEVESWATKWRTFEIHGRQVTITAICDSYGYIIWPERDGSRIF